MTTYRVTEAPSDGTTGQFVGEFALSGLPNRLRSAVEASPEAGRWTLPALSEGDSGSELSDLSIVIVATEPYGDLHDYSTGEFIRLATKAEREASDAEVARGHEEGLITVDGRTCYVDP